MKEIGIIMSGDHPRLILEQRKVMTRRTYGLEFINKTPDTWEYVWNSLCQQHEFYDKYYKNAPPIVVKCPYGGVGDTLIIKETWATENQYNHLKPSEVPRTAKIWYLADEHYDPQIMGKIRSAMFMCNWMSRAKPEITEVRAERLQEIKLMDIYSEGFETPRTTTEAIRQHFADLWDSLNAKRGYGWDKNNWVFPISFKLLSGQ